MYLAWIDPNVLFPVSMSFLMTEMLVGLKIVRGNVWPGISTMVGWKEMTNS